MNPDKPPYPEPTEERKRLHIPLDNREFNSSCERKSRLWALYNFEAEEESGYGSHTHRVFRVLCFYCRQRLARKQMTVEHVRPKSRGGSNRLHNLRPCCYGCNQKRGNLPIPEEDGALP